jgi:hypothetical protein
MLMKPPFIGISGVPTRSNHFDAAPLGAEELRSSPSAGF